MAASVPMNTARLAAACCAFGGVLSAAGATPQNTPAPADSYVAEITRARQVSDRQLRGLFSPLAKIQAHRLEAGRVLNIGSAAQADARLDAADIAPLHAVIEGDSTTPTVRAIAPATITAMTEPPRSVTTLTIKPGWGFRIGRFVFEYGVSENFGRMIQIFDPDAPAVRAFQGLEYFPIDPSYRVSAEIIPHESPIQLELIDSKGRMQKHWLYGELRFSLHGVASRLELYAETLDGLDQKGFMLIFTDLTSGKETYPGARYLTTERKASGTITIDFNRAFNPPCVYNPLLYACPFPRKENRLPVAVKAGAQWYRPPTAVH
jgi:uncharacterized protein (DUF1684 family)